MGEESIEACIEKLNKEVSKAEEKEMLELSEETTVLRGMRELLTALNESWDLLEKRIERSEISDDKKTHLLKALSALRKTDLEKTRLSMENLDETIDNVRARAIIEGVGKVAEANEVMFQLEDFFYAIKALEERIQKLKEPQRSSLLKKLQHLKNKSESLIENTIRKIEVIFNLQTENLAK